MSDNIKRTELLIQLFEQQLITADQLSRAKLYLQFISGTSFDSQDSAIDWLLENRIINERPVTEAQPMEQSPERPTKEPEIEPDIQTEPEEDTSESIEPDEIPEEISEGIPAHEETEESLEQSAIAESVTVEHVEQQDTIEQPQSITISSPQTVTTEPTESVQNANPLELLMLLYMSGAIDGKELKKAKTEVLRNPQTEFKNSDALLIWLEQKGIIKPAPIRNESEKTELTQKKSQPQQRSVPPKKSDVLPPKVKEKIKEREKEEEKDKEREKSKSQSPEKTATKKGGCLKKLILIGIAIVIINWYFKTVETPLCDNPDIYQAAIQEYLATTNSEPLPINRKDKAKESLLMTNPVVYYFARLTNIKPVEYDANTRSRVCRATVIYQASGNDKTATDIEGDIYYRIQATSSSKFIISSIIMKDRILQKVADENAYYQMRYEKDKPIKTAFIKGLAQVDELINNSKYNSTNQVKFISKNIHWLNVIGECQHVEDTQYNCPVEFGYKDGWVVKEIIPITLDMPVIKKGDGWEPTNKFDMEFLKVYTSTLREAITQPKAFKTEDNI